MHAGDVPWATAHTIAFRGAYIHDRSNERWCDDIDAANIGAVTPNDFYQRYVDRPHSNTAAGWAASTITAASFELSTELAAMIRAAELRDRDACDPKKGRVAGRVVGRIAGGRIIPM